MTFLNVDVAAGVATVVIDRPPANAVNPALIEEFLTVVPALADDPSVRVIVLTGVGRFFIAGADIAVMRDLSLANHVRMRRWIEVQRLLELAPKPVIAALNGHTLGGGAELSLACDLRLAAESATVGFPEMQLGLFPGAGGSQRLPRLLGLHRARLLMIEGRRLSAAEALSLGLIDEVLPDAGFAEAVAARAAAWAAKPTATIGLLKTSMLKGAPLDMEGAMAVEWEAVQQVLAGEDAAEGLQSFLDKRKPVFRGK
ncbi:enoyl-CoA hydratase/isomerase family protein [Paractinoplanes brasiliensis]|uniref:Short chain enoyl-CoA hydratase n=1 Tax=Paractinoplanes brasiliensis TaxID=52695 RepID=A0A4R6JLY0_9ACTN|nr:enoyl-CoA hydratase-related protein [Actinoplanes brasiliensis]TDO37383.1 short chain enoyl-CoA hydratase [Actinoplanes brasiliensis]GID29301.1 crotonase [Actinoplanes brasiliensis]